MNIHPGQRGWTVEFHLIILVTLKEIERAGYPDESTETQVLDLPLHVESDGLDVHGGEEIVSVRWS